MSELLHQATIPADSRLRLVGDELPHATETDGCLRSSPRRSVAAALAVYNGERYLGAQLASLVAQTWSNFKITVADADDASTDGSLEIVATA